jgi:hypothetical protein
LQGIIIGWRVSPRQREYVEGQAVNTEYGIEFLLEQTTEPFQWVGDGAAEKGYRWQPIPPQAVAI